MQYKDMVKPVSISPKMKTKQKEYLNKGALPIIDQGQKLIGGYSNNLNMQVSCTLPVVVFGDHTKVVKYIDFPFGAGADGIKVLQPRDGILPKYLFYGTKYLTYRIVNKGYARHYQHIEKMSFSVLSLPEQDRIVSRIEALFSELDKAVEALQTTKKQLAVYRQAVLKETFDKAGEIQTPLNQIIEKPRYGTSKKCSYNLYDNSIPVYRIPNVNYCNGTIDHNDLKYGSFTENEFENLKLNVGDILIIRSNGSVSLVGRSAIISEKDTHGLFAGYLMRLRIKSEVEVLPQYLNLYLNTHYARTQIERMAKSTSGVNNINSDEICSICLPICDIATQKEMIQEIEIQLSVCDNIEKAVDAALSQAEAVRESALQQAFEGAL